MARLALLLPLVFLPLVAPNVIGQLVWEQTYPVTTAEPIPQLPSECGVEIFPLPALDCPIPPYEPIQTQQKFLIAGVGPCGGCVYTVDVNDETALNVIFKVWLDQASKVCIDVCDVMTTVATQQMFVSVDPGDITPNEYRASLGSYSLATRGSFTVTDMF